jgi:hypothetical protein
LHQGEEKEHAHASIAEVRATSLNFLEEGAISFSEISGY